MAFKKSGLAWGLLSVLIWSTSATVGGLLEGQAAAIQIVLIMQIAAIAFFLFFARKDFDALKRDFAKLWQEERLPRALIWLCILATFTSLYHFSFYYSLHNMPRIEANIINYLWPLILLFFSRLIFRISKNAITVYDCALVFLALCGATVIAWDNPSHGILEFKIDRGLFAALTAAVTAPIYMCTAVILSRHYFSKAYFPFFLAFLVSAPILGGMILLTGGAGTPPISFPSFLWIIYLGILPVAIAQVSWSRALSIGPTASVSSLAYLVPVLSTILLAIVFSDQPSSKVVVGSTLIVVANILSSSYFKIVRAEAAALIAFFLTCFIIYFGKEIGLPRVILTEVNYIAEVFAILAGFFLAHVWQMMRERESRMLQFSLSLARLLRSHSSLAKDPEVKHRMKNLMISLGDLDNSKSAYLSSIHTSKLRANFEELEQAAANSLSHGRKDLEQYTSEAREDMERWIDVKFKRASVGEITILAILGFAVSAITVLSGPGGPTAEIIAAMFVACICFVVFKVVELNYAPVIDSAKRLVQMQEPIRMTGSRYYLPDQRVLLSGIQSTNIGQKITSRSAEGALVDVDWNHATSSPTAFKRLRLFLSAMLSFGIILVTLVLYQQA